MDTVPCSTSGTRQKTSRSNCSVCSKKQLKIRGEDWLAGNSHLFCKFYNFYGGIFTVLFCHDLNLGKGPETIDRIQRKRCTLQPVILPPLVHLGGFCKPKPGKDLFEDLPGFHGRIELFAGLQAQFGDLLSLVGDKCRAIGIADPQGLVGRAEIAVRGVVIDVMLMLLSQKLRMPGEKVLPDEIEGIHPYLEFYFEHGRATLLSVIVAI